MIGKGKDGVGRVGGCMGWVTEGGSVQSGDDSSGEEQLRSVISFNNMSDHLFANIIFAESNAEVDRGGTPSR